MSELQQDEFNAEVARLVTEFFGHDQEIQGAMLLAVAQRFLSDLGAQQVKFGMDRGEPLTVCFGRGVAGVMLAGAHEKIKSLLTGLPESETTVRFTNGQWVRITQGHLTGLKGQVTGYLNAKAILVNIPGRSRPIAASVEALETCDPPKGK